MWRCFYKIKEIIIYLMCFSLIFVFKIVYLHLFHYVNIRTFIFLRIKVFLKKFSVYTLLVPLPSSLGAVYACWLSIAGSACGRKDHLMVCFLTDPASKAARDIIIYFCIVWVAYIWKWAIYHFQWAWVKPTGRTRSWLVRSRWR